MVTPLTYRPMDKIVAFLKGIHLNDNREWYLEHRLEYSYAFNTNARYIQQMAKMIGEYDINIRYLRLSDCSYALARHRKIKINKRLFNDYIGGFFARCGKHSGYAGYYYQLSPEPSDSGGSLIAVGIFNPSREVLDWFRRDAEKNGARIMELIEKSGFEILTRDKFVRLPSGYAIDEEYRDLLLMRHIMLVKRVDVKWFYHEQWMERTVRAFRRCKPFIDHINAIIDEHKIAGLATKKSNIL